MAGCSRTPGYHLPNIGKVKPITSISAESFLPTTTEISAVKTNIIVIVSRILTQYIHDLSPMSKAVTQHIIHKYSSEMSKKSEVVLLDVLMKNEAKASDMIEIMKKMHEYLSTDYSPERKVAAGGDQLTCERQAASQSHMMYGNTPLLKDTTNLDYNLC